MIVYPDDISLFAPSVRLSPFPHPGAYFASETPEKSPMVVTVHPDLLHDPELTRDNFVQLLDSIIHVSIHPPPP